MWVFVIKTGINCSDQALEFYSLLPYLCRSKFSPG